MTANDKIARIKAAYERDQREKPKARTLEDIPVSYEAITPEWFSAVLCAGAPGAAVTGLKLDAVDNGTSNRRRIFIEYNQAGINAGLPRSVFCKATHDLVNRLILSSTGTYSEVSFYNRIRPLLDIDTPSAYLAAYDPESWASIIVLEDVAGEVTFCDEHTPMNRASAESQLSLLASMHGRFLGDEARSAPLSELYTFPDRFKGLAERHGIEACCREGFLASEAEIPPRLFARAAEIWPATVEAVERQRDRPETFTHNDVHLKNWFVRERLRMGLSDWQSSGRGHWARDIAYAISTALEPEDRRKLERELIAFYLDRLGSVCGQSISFDEGFRLYREQLPAALAWWTMTLTPSADMPDMQPEDTSRTFIRRIATAMDDLDSLATLR